MKLTPMWMVYDEPFEGDATKARGTLMDTKPTAPRERERALELYPAWQVRNTLAAIGEKIRELEALLKEV